MAQEDLINIWNTGSEKKIDKLLRKMEVGVT